LKAAELASIWHHL